MKRSPLADSNRGPPPYHLTGYRCESAGFSARLSPSLTAPEWPARAPDLSPKPVPRTNDLGESFDGLDDDGVPRSRTGSLVRRIRLTRGALVRIGSSRRRHFSLLLRNVVSVRRRLAAALSVAREFYGRRCRSARRVRQTAGI
jgi:hypothetical protein